METAEIETEETGPTQPRLRTQAITERPWPNTSAAPPAANTLDSPESGRADSSSSSLNEERRAARGTRGTAAPNRRPSGQGRAARPDSNSFCPRCGSTSSVTSVGSGGGNRASLHEAAASSTLQDVSEADLDISTEEVTEDNDTSTPTQAVGSGDYSVCLLVAPILPDIRATVPEVRSPLSTREMVRFVLEKIQAHREPVIIDDMERRLAQNELVRCSPFTIDHHGYKICPRIGLGKEHISFYIAVMKGESKKWPFTMIVFLRIINQSGGEHRQKMFHSYKNYSKLKECLRDPKSVDVANTAMGYPQFLSRGRLEKEGYIRNNEMHLECFFFPKEIPINHKPEVPSIFR